MGAMARRHGRIERYGARLAIAAVASCVVAIAARAQTSAAFRWQASADNGATWSSSSLSVPQTSASVLVRAVASWTPSSTDEVFARLNFDATVEGRLGSGLADGASAFVVGNPPAVVGGVQSVGTFRFGSILKIDRNTDASPPGLGSDWLSIFQLSGMIGLPPISFDNPITLFSYRLDLDGTPGQRQLSATLQSGFLILFPDWRSNQIRGEPISVEPLTLTVLPAPGAIALLALGGVVVASRRRR